MIDKKYLEDFLHKCEGFLLTWDNITKICSNKILYCKDCRDENKILINVQWMPFQLIGMCKILDIETRDKITGEEIKYDMDYLGKKIKKKLEKDGIPRLRLKMKDLHKEQTNTNFCLARKTNRDKEIQFIS